MEFQALMQKLTRTKCVLKFVATSESKIRIRTYLKLSQTELKWALSNHDLRSVGRPSQNLTSAVVWPTWDLFAIGEEKWGAKRCVPQIWLWGSVQVGGVIGAEKLLTCLTNCNSFHTSSWLISGAIEKRGNPTNMCLIRIVPLQFQQEANGCDETQHQIRQREQAS